MRLKFLLPVFIPSFWFYLLLLCAGCSNDTKAQPTKAEITLDPAVFSVDHPELFKLATIQAEQLPTILTAYGSVNPDVNRTIHVTSQGGGRVVELKTKLGDTVQKGQVLLSIYSSDLAGAFADYQKAVADEALSRKALDRAQLLYAHGAIAEKDVEQAQDAEDKSLVDVHNTEQHIHILGGNVGYPSSTIELRAPVSGTIVEQNIAGFEGVKSLDNSPNLFTIADLSEVWVLCDVYENDLDEVHLGDAAEVRFNAYGDRAFRGTVQDISRVLDPNIRSAKVRIVLSNPDRSLRPGMYAVATFRSKKMAGQQVVPEAAVMRLQDKDWVFRKESSNQFRQIEVRVSRSLDDGRDVLKGASVKAGDQVVASALQFSSAMAEQSK